MRLILIQKDTGSWPGVGGFHVELTHGRSGRHSTVPVGPCVLVVRLERKSIHTSTSRNRFSIAYIYYRGEENWKRKLELWLTGFIVKVCGIWSWPSRDRLKHWTNFILRFDSFHRLKFWNHDATLCLSKTLETGNKDWNWFLGLFFFFDLISMIWWISIVGLPVGHDPNGRSFVGSIFS